jgi:hypothetical protein
MVALFDHEEVGSQSAHGAGSPILVDALRRITSHFGKLAINGKSTNPAEVFCHLGFILGCRFLHFIDCKVSQLESDELTILD